MSQLKEKLKNEADQYVQMLQEQHLCYIPSFASWTFECSFFILFFPFGFVNLDL